MSMRSALFIGASGFALASPIAFAAETPNLGRTTTPEEIAAWDISIGPDGVGLPPGSGTPKQGEAVYAAKCVACHGDKGAGAPNDRLVGGQGTLPGDKPPVKTRRKLLALCHDRFRLCAAGHAVQRVEVTDQRRGLCSGCLYPEPQRHHRGRRYDGRADAAKSKNAEPGRFRDVFARKMKRASRSSNPRDVSEPQRGIGGCSPAILKPVGCSSGMSPMFPQVDKSRTLRSEPFSSQPETEPEKQELLRLIGTLV